MAKHFGYYDDWESTVLTCSKCGWTGTFDEGAVGHYNEVMDSSCPRCVIADPPMLAIVSYPTVAESHANRYKLSELERTFLDQMERFQSEFQSRKFRDPSQLPDIKSRAFTLHWDMDYADSGSAARYETLVKHGETVLLREEAAYEGYGRFIEVAKLLRGRYGPALRDLVPTTASWQYLYGDVLSAPLIVDEARSEIFEDVTLGCRPSRATNGFIHNLGDEDRGNLGTGN